MCVYTGSDAEFSLYEDEGINYNYEKGAYSRIPMRWDAASGTFSIGVRTGSFDGMIAERPVAVRIVSPAGVREFAGRYDGSELIFRTK